MASAAEEAKQNIEKAPSETDVFPSPIVEKGVFITKNEVNTSGWKCFSLTFVAFAFLQAAEKAKSADLAQRGAPIR